MCAWKRNSMSVKAIRLENFMAFADTGWIELRPITLLFGRNSSGKSAIIRALRLLRQTLEQPITQDTDGRPPLRFNHEHGVVLGNYTETVHGKDADRIMRFHFRCHVPTASDMVRQEINRWRQQNDLPPLSASTDDWLTLVLAFGYDAHRGSELVGIEIVCCWQITNEPGADNLLTAVWLGETRYEVGYDWWLDTSMPSWQELDWQPTTFAFPRNFLPELVASPTHVLTGALETLGETVADFLRGIEHVPPVRPEPQRVYLFDDVARNQWRQQGSGAFLDFLEGKFDDEKWIEVESWLQVLELGVKLNPTARQIIRRGYTSTDKYIEDQREYDATVTKVEIEERGVKRLIINLKNTGYGVSQVIPIIIQSVTTRQRVSANKEGQIIKARHVMIEQPELHLHPRAQARLTDLFINEIYTLDLSQVDVNGDPADEYRQPSGVTFLLETHSEHLLLRLQKRLTETSAGLNKKEFKGKNRYLMLKDFNIYFTQRDEGNSTVKPIQLNDLGEFIQFPDEFETFFADDLIEAGELAKLRLQARKKRRAANDNLSP